MVAVGDGRLPRIIPGMKNPRGVQEGSRGIWLFQPTIAQPIRPFFGPALGPYCVPAGVWGGSGPMSTSESDSACFSGEWDGVQYHRSAGKR